ncbi:hypothetical protein NKH70_30470 [Mesorhizobium sp. M0991]|uniref:hypothetical protein n=1 Tax=Mesorhizobium sp. M0991 TaxID=2957043 RepID=UPI00333657A6
MLAIVGREGKHIPEYALHRQIIPQVVNNRDNLVGRTLAINILAAIALFLSSFDASDLSHATNSTTMMLSASRQKTKTAVTALALSCNDLS